MKTLLASTLLAIAFTAQLSAADDVKPEKGTRYTIYLCAGQSNMDGRAQVKDLVGSLARYAEPQADVLIRYASGGLRRKLRTSDGIITLRPGCNESPANFGPELAFGRAIADAQPDKKIILIKVSEGGTNLFDDWNPDAPKRLYAQLLQLTRGTQALLENEGATSEIAGMIWLQGESDSAKNQADNYQERLTAFIARVRTDLKAEKMPFVIGQICAANPAYQQVIAAQDAVARSVPATGIASSDGLKTSDKNVHFDAPSQIELGKRFAAAFRQLDSKKNTKP